MMLIIILLFSAEADQHNNVRLADILNTSPKQVSRINHLFFTRLRGRKSHVVLSSYAGTL